MNFNLQELEEITREEIEMISDAKRECNARYQAKTKAILLKFNLQELEEYKLIRQHCEAENRTIQAYIKWLIRKDMENWK